MTEKRKAPVFWIVYTILTVTALAAIAGGLWLFRGYIAAYEASQPVHTAEAYAASLTPEAWRTLLGTASGTGTRYETPEMIREACLAMLADAKPEIRRSGEATASAPVYVLLNGNARVGRLVLAADGEDRYGFTRWRVSAAEVFPDAIGTERRAVVVRVPAGAAVTLNGVPLAAEDCTERLPDEDASPFERATAFCEIYEVEGLFADPAVACSYRGAECRRETGTDGAYVFRIPDGVTGSVAVTAPAGASVMLNGVPVMTPDGVIAAGVRTGEGIPYEVQPAEAGAAGLPRPVRYEAAGLLGVPAVSVTYNGSALRVTESSAGEYAAEYPAELYRSCTITAPSGAAVTMRGADCARYLTGETVPAYADLYDDPADAPALAVWSIDRLFLSPATPEVTLNGVPLACERTEDGSATTFTADFPQTEDAELADFARRFTEAYFTYTSQGYRDTRAHLDAVLAFVKSNSALAARLRRSLDGYSYTTPVTSDRRTITPGPARDPGDGSFVCEVRFAVDQRISSVTRSYRGTLTLRVGRSAGGFTVLAMTIDNE